MKKPRQLRFSIRTAWLAFAAAAIVLSSCGGDVAGPASSDPTGVQRDIALIEDTQLLVRESFPVQLALSVRGSLPTPCHVLIWEFEGPDEEGRIEVMIYSEVEEGEVCIQVLQPFEETIELGSYSDGSFSIWANGEEIGALDL